MSSVIGHICGRQPPVELATSCAACDILWFRQAREVAADGNPVSRARAMLLRAFSKALDELEQCWAREGLGELNEGSIEVVLRDEQGRSVHCKPIFSAGAKEVQEFTRGLRGT
jgi:hypothetical protein